MEYIKEAKKLILKAKNLDDIVDMENQTVDVILTKLRDDFYNELLEDDEIKNKLCEIANIDESLLGNFLVINGEVPLDDFDE